MNLNALNAIRLSAVLGSMMALFVPLAKIHADASAMQPRDGRHDFDFAFGRWKTHISRLMHPLTGSHEWVEYDGTHVIRKIWNGKANLGELQVDGSAGHIEAMSPRLYDPASSQWSIYYGNPRDGNLSKPVVGGSKQMGAESSTARTSPMAG